MMVDFSKVRALCLGDVVLDRFVSGDVTSISREAPVPVFRWGFERVMLGGVGNVVANLRSLGVETTLIARVGCDPAGARIRELLDRAGARRRLIESSAVPTIQKTRFVAKGHHVLKVDQDGEKVPSEAEEEEVLAGLKEILPQVDLVILSDYANGLLSASLSKRVIAECRRHGRPVYVDPRGKDYAKYAGATLVKPNRLELEIATGADLVGDGEDLQKRVMAAAGALLKKEGISEAVVTLSEKGMVYVPVSGEGAFSLPTRVVDVADVSGAGDTTMAVLAAARAAGAPMREAMALANAAAGIVVGKVGTATVSAAELAMALGESGKVFSREALAARVRAWQAEGLKVGFTNGCFDCLHCGHLSSLEQAREFCDRLVVAVNDDAYVRRHKGPTRPIQDERTRVQVLAGLGLVDAVTVFGEETAEGVLTALRPDVYAKEGYDLETLPEAALVRSWGGECRTLKRVPGYSTTEIEQRMKARGK